MTQCKTGSSCCSCHHGIDRRGFIKSCGAAAIAAATAGPLASLTGVSAADKTGGKVRVAAVFLMSMNTHEIWPYPGFDTKGRQGEILARLREGCPQIEFIPVSVEKPEDLAKAVAMKDDIDGYLVYVMTLVWSQTKEILDIGKLAKPMIVANEFLGGCGTFLAGLHQLNGQKLPATAVSTTRIEDLVLVTREFAGVRESGLTPTAFATRCERVYRGTFPARGASKPLDDSIATVDIADCLEQFRGKRFLIVGAGKPGEEHDFLGAKGRYIDFTELQSFYEKVDRDEAASWADRWSKRATALAPGDYIEPSQPSPEALQNSGGVYLATLELLDKYGADTVTMNCLGGFAAGKLPAYPCLGFMQLLDDGAQGVCEAMPDDTLSMTMARILTGRPGFVSDPTLDTSKNQIVYAHCVGTTKVFGPQGDANGYRIRTLHNRDPRGACSESMMPPGYMTTTFRTNVARGELVVHRAKSLGTIDSERGCRTKMVAEVHGDIGKMFTGWNRFGWHRVTVYGDFKEQLVEFAKALGLKIIVEA